MKLRRRSTPVKKWVYIVLIVLVILSCAPLMVKWYAARELRAEGYSVEISNLSLNVFTGKIGILGLDLSSSKGDRLKFSNVQLDIKMLALFGGVLKFESVSVAGGAIDVDSQDQNVSMGGFNLSTIGSTFGVESGIEVNRISVENIDICSHSKQRCLHVGAASVSDSVFKFNDNSWRFSHQLPLFIEKAFIRNLSGDVSVFYIGNLNISRAEYSSQALDLGAIKLQNFQFVKDDILVKEQSNFRTQTQVGELNISGLRYNAGDQPELFIGAIDAVSLRQGYSQQLEQVQKSTVIYSWLSDAYQLISKGLTGDSSVHLTLGSMTLQSGVLSWRDALVTPPVKEALMGIKVKLGPLDSHKPDQLAPLSVLGRLGDKGRIKFEGHVFPIGLNSTLKGRAEIEGWEMSPITAYTSKMFYKQVEEGSIDMSLSIDLHNKHLEVDSYWQMTGFQMGKGGANAKFVNAMKSLTTRNDIVRFSLPISGDLGSADLSVDYVFGRLVSNALHRLVNEQADGVKEASGDLVLGQRNRLTKMEFRSLLYSANADKPEELGIKRLWEIAELLKSKPNLVLFFCPVSTAGEWADIFNKGVKPGEGFTLHDAETETLRGLATARGQVLADMLMGQGVLSRQVKICEATIDMSQVGPSFVTVSM